MERIRWAELEGSVRCGLERIVEKRLKRSGRERTAVNRTGKAWLKGYGLRVEAGTREVRNG
jgi:hypothetical protein